MQRTIARQYLSLKRLNITELPPHSEFGAPPVVHTTTLSQFVDNVLTEVEGTDFDSGFVSHGVWSPESATVDMPPQAASPTDNQIPSTRPVPISVNRRVKGGGKTIWCARTSYHHPSDITYNELDALLSRDHSINECRYTPSVYDANELVKWSDEDLRDAIEKLGQKHALQDLEMSIFEMFHKMPKVGGISVLNDRVFYVLVMTAHNTHLLDDSTENPQSLTVQLPVDFKSIRQQQTIASRSHVSQAGSSMRYKIHQDGKGASSISHVQQQSDNNKLTLGNYVSLERFRHALKSPPANEAGASHVQTTDSEYQHRWDMMTLSDAGGISRLAPGKTKQKETLDAIAADVEYVIKFIAETRKSNLPPMQNGEAQAQGSLLSR